jgi:pimeloyl-ACP methyl ester carboxylesterase
MRIVEGAGVELAVTYESAPAGPATVLVHGMGGRAPAALAALDGRVVVYDRRGYGRSGAPEPYVRTTVSEHAEDLAALVRALDAVPAILVGADFGALVALDVLLRHPAIARGAVLVDPPAYMFVAEATEALSEQRAALEDELRELEPGALDAQRGRIADFGAIASLPLGHATLRELAAPIGIVSSERAQPHDLTAAEALLDATPAAFGAADVPGAVQRVARGG